MGNRDVQAVAVNRSRGRIGVTQTVIQVPRLRQAVYKICAGYIPPDPSHLHRCAEFHPSINVTNNPLLTRLVHMKSSHLLVVFSALIGACASTSQYSSTTPSTARVRFVAQGVGNVYFAVPKALQCSKKFGSALDEGDQLIAVLSGATNAYPKFGSPPVIGMPDAKRYPEWTFLETPMDADREVLLRATLVSSNGSPNDVGMCNSLTSVKLSAKRDYEVVMTSRGRQWHARRL